MLVFPNSKINLGLYITEKRTDGYHNLETIFYPISLHDILEIIPASGKTNQKVSFTNTGLKIDCPPEKNLCIKAYQLMDNDFQLPPVEIILHKVVPMGAGLGGGSADAAFTLTLLNELFHLNVSRENLVQYAAQLGSDCPIFIHNRPMLGSGKGDILTPITMNLAEYFLVLIKPPVSVGTAEAYQDVYLCRPEIMTEELVTLPISDWKNHLKNNFEINIFKNHPEIGKIKELLYQEGALYSAMSGSGSTVFGIFDKPVDISQLFPNYFYWSGKG